MMGNQFDPSAYMIASAVALGLQIEPEWREAVRSNLEIIFSMATNLETFELPGDLEPAPVFEA